MTFFILATVRTAPPVPPRLVRDSRNLWLESMDGTVVIQIARDGHPGPWRLLPGHEGLGVAPTELDTSAAPGVAGGFVEGVITTTRPTVLPLSLRTKDQAEQWERVQELRDLTDPDVDMTRDGNFKLVCSSASGTRELTLAYRAGLEGDSMDLPHYERVVLQAVAVQPFALDREERSAEFFIADTDAGFLAASSSDPSAAVFSDLALSPSEVIGEDMPVTMTSAVPVYPTVEITGPADSVLITADTGLRIDIPTGVDAGDTLRIVMDPRRASIRLNGAPAAGKLALGSKRAPLVKGTNLIDVAAPGATSDTKLRLSWRGGHRSLW